MSNSKIYKKADIVRDGRKYIYTVKTDGTPWVKPYYLLLSRKSLRGSKTTDPKAKTKYHYSKGWIALNLSTNDKIFLPDWILEEHYQLIAETEKSAKLQRWAPDTTSTGTYTSSATPSDTRE